MATGACLEPARRVLRLGCGRDGDGHRRVPVRHRAGKYDVGFGNCRAAGPPAVYGDGVVTPHAAFRALPYALGPVLSKPGRRENLTSTRTGQGASTTRSRSRAR